jgi:hypothetical protein
MPKFITIGYGDQDGYDRTLGSVRDAAHRHDEKLRTLGAVMGIAGRPVQVRNPENSGVVVHGGSYLTSKLPVAGFAVIDAANLDEAIELVAHSPCAVAHGVVEIWPLAMLDKE